MANPTENLGLGRPQDGDLDWGPIYRAAMAKLDAEVASRLTEAEVDAKDATTLAVAQADTDAKIAAIDLGSFATREALDTATYGLGTAVDTGTAIRVEWPEVTQFVELSDGTPHVLAAGDPLPAGATLMVASLTQVWVDDDGELTWDDQPRVVLTRLPTNA